MLTINDRWRGDSVIGTTEGWLNLLLPLAWACLLAFAVLEEPLTGDRHLWLTRPYRWQTLLSAKLLFALAFVHLPSLLAAMYIVTARGFSLKESLPHLLAGQVTLAAAITLPAIAMAALVGTFTQFMTLLFAVAAAAIFVTSGGPFRAMPDIQRPVDYLRPEFIAAIAGLSAIGICLLQIPPPQARRRTRCRAACRRHGRRIVRLRSGERRLPRSRRAAPRPRARLTAERGQIRNAAQLRVL